LERGYSSRYKQRDCLIVGNPGLANFKVKQCHGANIEKELLSVDELEYQAAFKFGIIYVNKGQKDENQWYSNMDGSEEFETFCKHLGDKIPLKGHSGFAAGMDTKSKKSHIDLIR
jgi:hypothetical protein